MQNTANTKVTAKKEGKKKPYNLTGAWCDVSANWNKTFMPQQANLCRNIWLLKINLLTNKSFSFIHNIKYFKSEVK